MSRSDRANWGYALAQVAEVLDEESDKPWFAGLSALTVEVDMDPPAGALGWRASITIDGYFFEARGADALGALRNLRGVLAVAAA